jgi:hypothetical protein
MLWGTLFEDVHKRYLEVVTGEEIYTTSSIPHPSVDCHRYSPDGLVVLTGDMITSLCQKNDKTGFLSSLVPTQEYTVLIEQKSPALKFVRTTSTIPDYYLP